MLNMAGILKAIQEKFQKSKDVVSEVQAIHKLLKTVDKEAPEGKIQQLQRACHEALPKLHWHITGTQQLFELLLCHAVSFLRKLLAEASYEDQHLKRLVPTMSKLECLLQSPSLDFQIHDTPSSLTPNSLQDQYWPEAPENLVIPHQERDMCERVSRMVTGSVLIPIEHCSTTGNALPIDYKPGTQEYVDAVKYVPRDISTGEAYSSDDLTGTQDLPLAIEYNPDEASQVFTVPREQSVSNVFEQESGKHNTYPLMTRVSTCTDPLPLSHEDYRSRIVVCTGMSRQEKLNLTNNEAATKPHNSNADPVSQSNNCSTISEECSSSPSQDTYPPPICQHPGLGSESLICSNQANIAELMNKETKGSITSKNLYPATNFSQATCITDENPESCQTSADPDLSAKVSAHATKDNPLEQKATEATAIGGLSTEAAVQKRTDTSNSLMINFHYVNKAAVSTAPIRDAAFKMLSHKLFTDSLKEFDTLDANEDSLCYRLSTQVQLTITKASYKDTNVLKIDASWCEGEEAVMQSFYETMTSFLDRHMGKRLKTRIRLAVICPKSSPKNPHLATVIRSSKPYFLWCVEQCDKDLDFEQFPESMLCWFPEVSKQLESVELSKQPYRRYTSQFGKHFTSSAGSAIKDEILKNAIFSYKSNLMEVCGASIGLNTVTFEDKREVRLALVLFYDLKGELSGHEDMPCATDQQNIAKSIIDVVNNCSDREQYVCEDKDWHWLRFSPHVPLSDFKHLADRVPTPPPYPPSGFQPSRSSASSTASNGHTNLSNPERSPGSAESPKEQALSPCDNFVIKKNGGKYSGAVGLFMHMSVEINGDKSTGHFGVTCLHCATDKKQSESPREKYHRLKRISSLDQQSSDHLRHCDVYPLSNTAQPVGSFKSGLIGCPLSADYYKDCISCPHCQRVRFYSKPFPYMSDIALFSIDSAPTKCSLKASVPSDFTWVNLSSSSELMLALEKCQYKFQSDQELVFTYNSQQGNALISDDEGSKVLIDCLSGCFKDGDLVPPHIRISSWSVNSFNSGDSGSLLFATLEEALADYNPDEDEPFSTVSENDSCDISENEVFCELLDDVEKATIADDQSEQSEPHSKPSLFNALLGLLSHGVNYKNRRVGMGFFLQPALDMCIAKLVISRLCGLNGQVPVPVTTDCSMTLNVRQPDRSEQRTYKMFEPCYCDQDPISGSAVQGGQPASISIDCMPSGTRIRSQLVEIKCTGEQISMAAEYTLCLNECSGKPESLPNKLGEPSIPTCSRKMAVDAPDSTVAGILNAAASSVSHSRSNSLKSEP